MKKSRLILLLIFGILCGIAALGITVYPLVGNYYSSKNKSTVLTEYTATVDGLEDGNIYELLSAAHAYNESLTPGVISIESVFTQAGQEYAAEDYYDMLNVNAAGIMGYVEIPKINVNLPIYHGTDSDTLEIGVGHLIGSSLPVGGESTHTILTGHSGMAREKMFSDLDQLRSGDLFYLIILDQTLAYEVDQIKTVLPDNTDYLGIERGQDYCTLVTCTPFGINTHRLLVRGHRVPYTESAEDEILDDENETAPVASTWQRQYIKGLSIALGLLVVGILFARMTIFRRKRGKHEKTR